MAPEDALAEGRDDVLPLARDMGARAEQTFDIFTASLRQLAYHGHLEAILEAMRVAWPSVQSSSDVLPWAIEDFSTTGVQYEIYNYLEHTESPDPRDRELVDRVRFFNAEADLDQVALLVDDLTGREVPTWTVNDFALQPVRQKSRDDWDEDWDEDWDDDEDEDEVEVPPDPGARNLSRLISQFIGYLRREEGVPYPRAELIQTELFRHFIQRHEGELDPRPGMLERMASPKKKLPPPPRPSHPLCPERVTLEVHLMGLIGIFSERYHTVSALFELVPAWLRFLESRGLIDAKQHAKTLQELRPLHMDLLRVMEADKEDPKLFEALKTWPAGRAKET